MIAYQKWSGFIAGISRGDWHQKISRPICTALLEGE